MKISAGNHNYLFSYKDAERYLLKALSQLQSVEGSVMSQKWESLLNNLGHVSRKLGKYRDSLEFHKQALVLSPLSASTFSAIGFTHALMGDNAEAVEAFHKALGIRREDTFATTMINNVVEGLTGEELPFQGQFFNDFFGEMFSLLYYFSFQTIFPSLKPLLPVICRPRQFHPRENRLGRDYPATKTLPRMT